MLSHGLRNGGKKLKRWQRAEADCTALISPQVRHPARMMRAPMRIAASLSNPAQFGA